MEHASKNQNVWWGQFNVELQQTLQWQLGPLKLAVERFAGEWQIAYETDDAWAEENDVWHHEKTAAALNTLDYANFERHTFKQTADTLEILPALADRSIVTRPLNPFYVAAGEETSIFVSSPLWARLNTNDPLVLLQEIPIHRPSDTWFGPSTMEGELCYASRTHGHLYIENISHHAYRAVTQLIIRNRSGAPLLIERLSLPVPYLSLFESDNGLLWTQTVTMTSTRDLGMAALDIAPGPAKQVGAAKLIGEPRRQSGQNMIVRAFGALFR